MKGVTDKPMNIYMLPNTHPCIPIIFHSSQYLAVFARLYPPHAADKTPRQPVLDFFPLFPVNCNWILESPLKSTMSRSPTHGTLTDCRAMRSGGFFHCCLCRQKMLDRTICSCTYHRSLFGQRRLLLHAGVVSLCLLCVFVACKPLQIVQLVVAWILVDMIDLISRSCRHSIETFVHYRMYKLVFPLTVKPQAHNHVSTYSRPFHSCTRLIVIHVAIAVGGVTSEHRMWFCLFHIYNKLEIVFSDNVRRCIIDCVLLSNVQC